MTTLIRERRAGVMHKCDAGCYDAKTPSEECKCICGGSNHRKGVSDLFGDDVPRKTQYLANRMSDFTDELRRRSLTDGVVYGGIRLDPSQKTVSDVEVYVAAGGGAQMRQIVHHCGVYKRKQRECRSPTGFNWSYGGSGPTELARYILAHALGHHYYYSPHAYMQFRTEFLAGAGDTWILSREEIQAWNVKRLAAERREHSGRPRLRRAG